MRLLNAIRCLPLLALLAGNALADDRTNPAIADAVAGHDGLVYADLLRLLAPDLAEAAGVYTASKLIALRHIGEPDMASASPAAIEPAGITAFDITAGGKPMTALLIDFGESEDSVADYAVLAVYDLTGKPLLLDAADISYDRYTSFREPGRIALGDRDDLLIASSSHFNSNQGYVTSAMIMVRDDRLELVDTIFTFDENLCAFERWQNPSFKTLPRQNGRASIVVTVTETVTSHGEDCGETSAIPTARQISATYNWDEATQRFISDSDALKRLAKESEERF